MANAQHKTLLLLCLRRLRLEETHAIATAHTCQSQLHPMVHLRHSPSAPASKSSNERLKTRVSLERYRERLDCAVQDVTASGRDNHATLSSNITTHGGGYIMFTPDLHRVVWPMKFRSKLPPHYDDNPNPIKFLQLYTVGMQAAGGYDKLMDNWFPMALKDAARSWTINLPKASISSWGELFEQFVANFKGHRK